MKKYGKLTVSRELIDKGIMVENDRGFQISVEAMDNYPCVVSGKITISMSNGYELQFDKSNNTISIWVNSDHDESNAMMFCHIIIETPMILSISESDKNHNQCVLVLNDELSVPPL